MLEGGQGRRGSRGRALAGWLSLLALSGCGPCSPSPPGPPAPTDSGPPDPEEIAPLPPARPWAFREVRGLLPVFAAPAGCRQRAPTLRAEAQASTGFIAERSSLGALVIADAAEDASRLEGVSATRFDAAGAILEQRPLPWMTPEAAPRLARTAAGGWAAAFGERTDAGSFRLGLWRDDAAEHVGEGDRFEAADLWCAQGQCALLTTRLGRVAMPGAEVWLGGAGAPVAGWKRVVIEPREPGADAHPLGIAGISGTGADAGVAADAGTGAVAVADAGTGAVADAGADAGADADAAAGAGAGADPGATEVLVATAEGAEVVFSRVDRERAQEIGRLAAPHGVLDVLGLPEPTAMLHGTAVGDDGCVIEPAEPAEAPPAPGVGRARVRFAQGSGIADVQVPAPPLRGALRRLTRGALATWIAPLGCKVPRRVVYAVRLDEAGKPAGEVIPVADAERYAVASSGDEVDLWLQASGAVTWVRLTCGGAR